MDRILNQVDFSGGYLGNAELDTFEMKLCRSCKSLEFALNNEENSPFDGG